MPGCLTLTLTLTLTQTLTLALTLTLTLTLTPTPTRCQDAEADVMTFVPRGEEGARPRAGITQAQVVELSHEQSR